MTAPAQRPRRCTGHKLFIKSRGYLRTCSCHWMQPALEVQPLHDVTPWWVAS